MSKGKLLNIRNSEGHKMIAGIIFAFVIAIVTITTATAQAQLAGSAPSRATARYEIDFMQGMIDHHAMAIMMAEMCVEKAVHEELRTLCQGIITAQQQEITQMQSWLSSWYGITYEPHMTQGDMRMMERMEQMAGGEFEMEFMKMMIKHHLKAIREASRCVDRVYHEQLEDLCENIITSQAPEIQQMRTWLCQWYAVCRNT